MQNLKAIRQILFILKNAIYIELVKKLKSHILEETRPTPVRGAQEISQFQNLEKWKSNNITTRMRILSISFIPMSPYSNVKGHYLHILSIYFIIILVKPSPNPSPDCDSECDSECECDCECDSLLSQTANPTHTESYLTLLRFSLRLSFLSSCDSQYQSIVN
jgi:hypothetical protein